MQKTKKSGHRHITSFQIIILGFLSVILFGSLFLMLPVSAQSGQVTPFRDALFTATSALVCLRARGYFTADSNRRNGNCYDFCRSGNGVRP